MYDEYFYSVRNIFGGKGWYEENPTRADLDWLYKFPPNRRVVLGREDLLPANISDITTLYRPADQ
jgi:hypothetical protein